MKLRRGRLIAIVALPAAAAGGSARYHARSIGGAPILGPDGPAAARLNLVEALRFG